MPASRLTTPRYPTLFVYFSPTISYAGTSCHDRARGGKREESSMSDFALFKTTEEHEELLEAVRSVAEDKIAPHAAEVDEKSVFPQDALEALVATDFHAPHIDEAYEGMGADALATC